MQEDEAETRYLLSCHQNRVNVEVLTGFDNDGAFKMGVRLRPWGGKSKS